MSINRERIIKIVLMAAFFICMLFANFYAIRKMGRYGAELFIYDKLLVAYNVAGRAGLEKELEEVFTEKVFPRELSIAKEFKEELKNLKDPAGYLSAKVTQSRANITLLRNLRTVAILLMFFIFGWQLVNKLLCNKRTKELKKEEL